MGWATVENAAHLHNGASKLDPVAENLRAVRRRKNRLAHVQTDFAPVDIKGGNDFDVVWSIAADLTMHQPDAGAVGGGAIIKIDSLNERAGAISDAYDCDSYFSHCVIAKAGTLPDLHSLEQATS
jgi:hypothetical protein